MPPQLPDDLLNPAQSWRKLYRSISSSPIQNTITTRQRTARNNVAHKA